MRVYNVCVCLRVRKCLCHQAWLAGRSKTSYISSHLFSTVFEMTSLLYHHGRSHPAFPGFSCLCFPCPFGALELRLSTTVSSSKFLSTGLFRKATFPSLSKGTFILRGMPLKPLDLRNQRDPPIPDEIVAGI